VRAAGDGPAAGEPGAGEISVEGRRLLLERARQAIEGAVSGRPRAEIETPGAEGELARRRGAFVTLTGPDGDLRGCVGVPEPIYRVDEAVERAAVSAAVHDSRFHPITRAELPTLVLHVSVLSELRPIAAEAVEVGRHGLVIRHEGRSGLLLPQVAAERGWDRLRFLDETCRKAGLPPGTWRVPGCEILAFTATVFSETDAG
jgi:AmmeMemoRadiSam system protein A